MRILNTVSVTCIKMVTGKDSGFQMKEQLAKEVNFSELSRSDVNLLKMAWNISGLMRMCRFLLLVILFPPCEVTSSVLTVNDRTENYILDTWLGSQESLKCAVQNHTREEELLWYREEGTVDLKSGNKINSSSVCVSSISENDNGVTFTCKLQSDQSVSVSVVLNVIYDFQAVEEGSDVKLVCSVKSNPQAQMMWYRNSNILNLEKTYQVHQTSESLQLSITKVKKSDNGTYSCVANSSLQVETKDFHLIVKDRTVALPIEPIIAACVVVFLTLCFGLIARRKRIMKDCVGKPSNLVPHSGFLKVEFGSPVKRCKDKVKVTPLSFSLMEETQTELELILLPDFKSTVPSSRYQRSSSSLELGSDWNPSNKLPSKMQ
ncbi:hypothetical protein GH733_013920 [Mirounga leonina]|nr:hypothetical protein GH733_013920 [Mirounga leonina]